jgi:hypothetical protein
MEGCSGHGNEIPPIPQNVIKFFSSCEIVSRDELSFTELVNLIVIILVSRIS